ncbi:MAG: SpoIID/LytB domain-containing protein [Armatimonadetes bacterium]|nr:SpoIID/LytB domain-containing protein [Armatimonadota bacterium]
MRPRRQRLLPLGSALLLLALVGAAPALTLRVELCQAGSVKLAGPVRIAAPNGAPLVVDQVSVAAADGALRSSGGTRWPNGTRFEPFQADSLAVTTSGTHHYRGVIVLHAVGARLSVVNHVDLEDYVQGVVPYEIDPDSQAAALAAQAVAARGFAVFRLRATPGAAPRCDFTVAATQAYRGTERENAGTVAAVRSTAGRVVLRRDELVESLYSDCCGGIVASAEDAWNSPQTGLASRWDRAADGAPRLDDAALGRWLSATEDSWCRANRLYRWSRTTPLGKVLSAATAWAREHPSRGRPGTVREVSVARRSPGGRVVELALRGDRGTATVRGDGMRWVFGDGDEALPSSLVRWGLDGGQMAFHGAGYGHGVGLCQTGAMAQAKAGRSAEQIIAFYYDGARVGAIPAR